MSKQYIVTKPIGDGAYKCVSHAKQIGSDKPVVLQVAKSQHNLTDDPQRTAALQQRLSKWTPAAEDFVKWSDYNGCYISCPCAEAEAVIYPLVDTTQKPPASAVWQLWRDIFNASGLAIFDIIGKGNVIMHPTRGAIIMDYCLSVEFSSGETQNDPISIHASSLASNLVFLIYCRNFGLQGTLQHLLNVIICAHNKGDNNIRISAEAVSALTLPTDSEFREMLHTMPKPIMKSTASLIWGEMVMAIHRIRKHKSNVDIIIPIRGIRIVQLDDTSGEVSTYLIKHGTQTWEKYHPKLITKISKDPTHDTIIESMLSQNPYYLLFISKEYLDRNRHWYDKKTLSRLPVEYQIRHINQQSTTAKKIRTHSIHAYATHRRRDATHS